MVGYVFVYPTATAIVLLVFGVLMAGAWLNSPNVEFSGFLRGLALVLCMVLFVKMMACETVVKMRFGFEVVASTLVRVTSFLTLLALIVVLAFVS